PMAGCGPTQPALAAAPANPDCHGPGPGARRERLDGAPLAAYRAAPGRPTGQALVRLARGGGGPHRVPLTHAARRGAAVSGTLDGCPPIRVTVTTDARTAELLRDAGLKPVEIPELDEGILNPLVAEYETTIFSTATLEPLSRARRLALELRRRGSRPRMVRCDGWSGTLAELVTTDAGRAEVRQLIADAPLCEFPEMEDEPGSTSASVLDAPAIPEDILPAKVGALIDHFAQACDAKRELVLLAALAALAAALGANWKVGARSMVRSAVLWF